MGNVDCSSICESHMQVYVTLMLSVYVYVLSVLHVQFSISPSQGPPPGDKVDVLTANSASRSKAGQESTPSRVR